MPSPSGIAIKGTRANDTITVVFNGVVLNGTLKSYTPADVASGVSINGDAGNDHITGGSGADQLIGFSGTDTLIGGAGFDKLVGGDGNDTLIDAVEGATFDGGSGVDLLDLSATTRNIGVDLQGTGSIFLDINLHRDPFMVSGPLPNPITGRIISVENLRTGSGDDLVIGNASANILDGGAGADGIWGRAGNDAIYGRDGDDHLGGEQGSDTLYGGAGADVFCMTSGNGHDTVMDYSTGDRIYFYGVAKPTQWTLTSDGRSLVGTFESGLSSVTILNVTSISQVIVSSQIVGTTADDTLSSGGDYDQLVGWDGNDVLLGNGGDDHLEGDLGKDVLNGGEGNDYLRGGAGGDTFVFEGSAGNDTIADFVSGTDLIDLRSYQITEAQISRTINGQDTVLTIDSDANGTSNFNITLSSVGTLSSGDYLF